MKKALIVLVTALLLVLLCTGTALAADRRKKRT